VTLSGAAWLGVAAFTAGAINSVAGGGSFLTFPALILAGVPPIPANATNNFAMWFGTAAGARGFKEEVRMYRHVLWPAIAVSVVGSLLGAALLLRTPVRVFALLIPFLLLFATLIFALSPLFTKRRSHGASVHTPVQLVAQFIVSIYGGYFGAGIGFLMLAILAFSGLPNLNAMNGLKNVLAMVINGVALVPFIAAGIIWWPQGLLMAICALGGGYLGARALKRLPQWLTRALVIVLGCVMSVYFFWRLRA